MDFGQGNAAARSVFFIHAPGKDRRRAIQAGMMQQQPGQLGARVPRNSHNR